jgi:biopolymer transport protein ExbD
MAGGGQRDAAGLFADINVTPLVDVTLVLLIIFMVAAPLMVSNPSIKVELPKAATGDESTKALLALTMQRRPTAGYDLFVNGVKADEPVLREKAGRLLAANPELQAIVAADRGIAYGDVMHIVDLVKAVGIHKFALSTDPNP